MRLAGPESRRREVDRLVEPKPAGSADLLEVAEVRGGLRGCDHRGESRCIGGDDMIVTQAALQPEPRNAETGILIGKAEITSGIGGLRGSPGRAPRCA